MSSVYPYDNLPTPGRPFSKTELEELDRLTDVCPACEGALEWEEITGTTRAPTGSVYRCRSCRRTYEDKALYRAWAVQQDWDDPDGGET